MAKKTPWTQELIWCRRNEAGVLIDISEILPAGQAYIPIASAVPVIQTKN